MLRRRLRADAELDSNEAAIAADLPPVKDKKGISKLERFLEAKGYPHVDRDIALVRRIQEWRSRIAAHTSGSSRQAFLAEQLEGLSKADFIAQLMREAMTMFTDLADLDDRLESAGGNRVGQ